MSSRFIILILSGIICFTGVSCEDELVDPSLPLERIGDKWLESEIFNSELIKKYKIISVIIEDCQGASCYRDSIAFNGLGKISYDQPRFGTAYHYVYDELGRVIMEIGGGELVTEYTYLKSDSVLAQYLEFDNNSNRTVLAQAKFKVARPFRERAVYDAKGRMVEDTTSDLMFPCAELSVGDNVLKYDYFENGLLKAIRYYNSAKDLISQDVFYYMREDGRVIDMH